MYIMIDLSKSSYKKQSFSLIFIIGMNAQNACYSMQL